MLRSLKKMIVVQASQVFAETVTNTICIIFYPSQKIKKFFCVKYGVTKDPDSQKHLDGEEKLMLKR